jgi:ankyrin repeat protein
VPVEQRCRPVHHTPLHIAAGADAAKVVAVLLARGASPNTRNDWVQTPLHQAALEARSGVEVSKLLLDAGAEMEIHDKDGFTALIAAAASGNTDLVRLLVTRGANVNATNDVRATALDNAVYYPEMAEFLRSKGANPGSGDVPKKKR